MLPYRQPARGAAARSASLELLKNVIHNHADILTCLKIFVNGKMAYRLSRSFSRYGVSGSTAKLITLKNGERYLYLYCIGFNDDGPQEILHYKNGKFVRVVNFNTLTRKHAHHTSTDIKSVSGNAIKVSMALMSYTVGVSKYTLKYRYKNGKLIQKANAARFNSSYGQEEPRTFIVNRTIKVFTTAKREKVAFKLRKGDRVKILSGFRISKNNTVYHIKYGKKYGWIVGDHYYPGINDVMFSNAQFAG